MRCLGLTLLTSLLAGCVTPASQPLVSDNSSSSPTSKPLNSPKSCAELQVQPAAISFAALYDSDETWNFAVFPHNEAEPFAWLCGKFWLPIPAAEPANGSLEILLSPHSYQELQTVFQAIDFFSLPTLIGVETTTMPRYSIAAADIGGQMHRVTFGSALSTLATPEQKRLKQLWNALNSALPQRLALTLTP